MTCQIPYTEFDWLIAHKRLPQPQNAGHIDQPCPECGHMAVVHPGPGNPALETCVLCQLVSATQVGT